MKNDQERARIGYVGNLFEVFVVTDDKGAIPHVHLRRLDTNDNEEIGIRLDSKGYFPHESATGKFSNNEEIYAYNKFMISKNPNPRYPNNYFLAIDMWNMNNALGLDNNYIAKKYFPYRFFVEFKEPQYILENSIRMITLDQHDVKIFTDKLEEVALNQIQQLMEIDVFKDCKVRIMPDVHAGAGCVIGFTGDLGDKVIPNIVGVDIGCGILVQPFECRGEINFHKLHNFINENIPSGRNVRDGNYKPLPDKFLEEYKEAKELIKQMRCYRELKDPKRLNKSVGSLGGGNHFIEIDKDPSGLHYLVVHTGSRNLGKQVAEYYQKLAVKCMSGWDELLEVQQQMIAEYKAAGKSAALKEAIRQLHCTFKMRRPSVSPALAYLEGRHRDDYLHDMRLCQRWAEINREIISCLIMDYLFKQHNVGLCQASFESVHNYIADDNIIRKGAISAKMGQKCIIPLNMRDGSLICTGKGNADWNCSAPHGAGRVMSRTRAFQEISMDEFAESMKGIYSETVNEDTKDESPMVYKPKEEILENIRQTVQVGTIIKPVFNFKAAE